MNNHHAMQDVLDILFHLDANNVSLAASKISRSLDKNEGK